MLRLASAVAHHLGACGGDRGALVCRAVVDHDLVAGLDEVQGLRGGRRLSRHEPYVCVGGGGTLHFAPDTPLSARAHDGGVLEMSGPTMGTPRMPMPVHESMRASKHRGQAVADLDDVGG